MTGKFAGTVLNMGCKLAEIFQTIQGWCVAMCVFVANFFAGYEGAINAVIVCVVLDTVWGIAAQIKRGHFALSELGRHGMLSKLALYASVIVGFILFDQTDQGAYRHYCDLRLYPRHPLDQDEPYDHRGI